jgi:hypothetical protein
MTKFCRLQQGYFLLKHSIFGLKLNDEFDLIIVFFLFTKYKPPKPRDAPIRHYVDQSSRCSCGFAVVPFREICTNQKFII